MLPTRESVPRSSGQLDHTKTTIKRCKLHWYGHVYCSSSLAKTISQGTVKGVRRRGRQKKRWEDNTREWTCLEFAKSQRAVENREKWRKLVVKSSVVPQDFSQLRDRWWWWWWYISHRKTINTEVILIVNVCYCTFADTDPRSLEIQEEGKPPSLPLSYVLR